MKYSIQDNKIILSEKPKKIKNGIKVYSSRDADEREMGDYAILTADLKGKKELGWFEDFNVIKIMIKRPILFGILGYKWELLEKQK